MREAVKGVRTVYHLAVDGGSPDARRVTIEGTRNVVEAAIEAGAECVVVLSTMYVFGFPETDEPVDETAPYRPYGGVYARSKAVMERWCLRRAATSGATRIVVLNPSCVFGPGGGAAYATTPRAYELADEPARSAGSTAAPAPPTTITSATWWTRCCAPPRFPRRTASASSSAMAPATWRGRSSASPLLGAPADAYPSYTARELEALNRQRERFEPRALALRAVVAARRKCAPRPGRAA